MGITSSDKKIDADAIDCDGSLKVTISLTACPDIASNPADIVLLLDSSGSMLGSPLENMKSGAKKFIDVIAEASGGAADGVIAGGSKIAVVSFASAARVDLPLTDDTAALKAAVNALSAGGKTNHYEAFTKGAQLLNFQSDNQKAMLMFTDGLTTIGGAAEPAAAAARDEGVIIYCIGLQNPQGFDINALNSWATDPDSTHVAITSNPEELDALFARVAAGISKAGATEIVIDEVINEDFVITEIIPPEKGSVEMISPTALKWSIPALGARTEESAALEFFIRHISDIPGVKAVNASISYNDAEGSQVAFPEPTVDVNCDIVVIPEECPLPVPFSAESCKDFIVFDAGDVRLESQGRIIQLDVTLMDVCPGKRTALAVILTEEDSRGNERPRGIKTFTIPAHDFSGCRDILVKCIRFVAPEDISLSGAPDSLCSPRNFKVRFIAHPIDFDYRCCDDSEEEDRSAGHPCGCRCRCGDKSE